MTVAGRIAFLPWVKLPKPAIVGGFRFVPTTVQELGNHVARAQLWSRFPGTPFQIAKRIKPDNCPKLLPEQLSWPIH